MGGIPLLHAQSQKPIQLALNGLKRDGLSQICPGRWTARIMGQPAAAGLNPAIILLLARKMFANITPRAVQVTVAIMRRLHLVRRNGSRAFRPRNIRSCDNASGSPVGRVKARIQNNLWPLCR
jgi:hypothetical protein